MYIIYVILFLSIFFIGLAIGSFINLLIFRLPQKQSIIKNSSHCDYCGHKLGKIELIPLFSYFILGGKCKNCKHPLPEFYPFMELASGVVFVLCLLSVVPKMDINSITSIYYYSGIALLIAFFLSIFVFFAAYDLMYREVPDKFSLPIIETLLGVNILLTIYSAIYKADINIAQVFYINPVGNIVSGFCAAALIALIVYATKGKGMGGGDIRIAAMIGLSAGVRGTVVALYLSFVIGAIFGLCYAAYKRKLRGVEVPFVPFLTIGAILGFLYGDQIFKFIFPLV